MGRIIATASDGLDWAARRGALLCLGVMFVVVMLQVFSRYLFNSPPSWAEELARYMMIWLGLLGATMSFKSRMDAVLVDSVFPPSTHWLGLFADLVQSLAVLMFLGPIIYYSVLGLGGSVSRGFLARQAMQTSDTLGIPMVCISISVPLFALVCLMHMLARWSKQS